jgi:hypothetical protein
VKRKYFHILLATIIILLVTSLCRADQYQRERDACVEMGFGYLGCDITSSVLESATQGRYPVLCQSVGWIVPVGFGILWNNDQIKEFGPQTAGQNNLDKRQIMFGASLAVAVNVVRLVTRKADIGAPPPGCRGFSIKLHV